MRESKIRNYRPKFKTPFYPWIQIAGIVGFVFLITQMGIVPLILVGCFLVFGFGWYWFYARDKIWREYTLLHIIERVSGEKSTGYLVDEELREILIERDNVTEKKFEKLIRDADVIDLYKYMRPDKLNYLIVDKLATKLELDPNKFYKILIRRERDSSSMVHPGIIIISHRIKGRDKLGIILVRSKMGMVVSDDVDPIHAFFVIVSSPDHKSFYMHSLMWIIRIAEDPDFEEQWINAKDSEELKEVILKAWRKSKSFQ
jgi:mannitol/fructose-specific phosphotransferase system IIA component (Ntr-type)